ncbi:hypothetical protein [Maritalea sp. S77]|uniref:hypothetical protein n=1 Tax=Maritalea sp. S77 TaxID=3415125 RepID=UPI003C7D2E04
MKILSNLKRNLAYNKAVKLLRCGDITKSREIVKAYLESEPNSHYLMWHALLVELELRQGDVDAAVRAKNSAEGRISSSTTLTPADKIYLHFAITNLFPDRYLVQNVENWYFVDPRDVDLTKVSRIYRNSIRCDFNKKSLIQIIKNNPDRVLALKDFL